MTSFKYSIESIERNFGLLAAANSFAIIAQVEFQLKK